MVLQLHGQAAIIHFGVITPPLHTNNVESKGNISFGLVMNAILHGD